MAVHSSVFLRQALDKAIKWEESFLDAIRGCDPEAEKDAKKFLKWARDYREKRWGKPIDPFVGVPSVTLQELRSRENGPSQD